MLIKEATIVHEGSTSEKDVLIKGERIERIDNDIAAGNEQVIDARGLYLIPGVIDDQVHFREPGLTHKATIYSESRAAVAGGVTSFMEMPNTVPNTLTQQLLEEKYEFASGSSLANYSFYMGTSNDNLEEILKTDKTNICGIKIFMGSSTGNMLVDEQSILESLFSKVDMLIATHCEDEATIRNNIVRARDLYGEDVPIVMHPEIRSAEACYLSSSMAVGLAKKYNSRLHVLHISTAKELELFSNDVDLKDKRITAEACIHHLWFCDKDYDDKGALIKWNPAIKTAADRDAILQAVIDGQADVIATDHAPHTLAEKQNTYFDSPAGGPMVQHGLVAMLELAHQGKITLGKIVEKMCHNPALLFNIKDRGFIREGYFADLVLVNPQKPWQVNESNIMAKCGWSPFEGQLFHASVVKTLVNGAIVYDGGRVIENMASSRLAFDRD